MSVARITADAGVSRRTFYDVFEDREDCFLCAFEDAASRARETMLAAPVPGSGWREQIRAALLARLELLEQDPTAISSPFGVGSCQSLNGRKSTSRPRSV